MEVHLAEHDHAIDALSARPRLRTVRKSALGHSRRSDAPSAKVSLRIATGNVYYSRLLEPEHRRLVGDTPGVAAIRAVSARLAVLVPALAGEMAGCECSLGWMTWMAL